MVFDSDAGINIPPNKRKVGFLFQNYALWPNMTVYQNIAFGLANIKEELPKYDLEARRTAALIRILQRPDDVVRTIRECVDKKGRLDVNKAHIKLIDRYEISLHTAKTLMGYKLHESMEPVTVAKARLEQLEKALESARAACAAQGCTFREDFAYLKDGVPVTGVRKLSPEEIALSVRRVARSVIIGMFMDRYPSELSGGQQQRVAIARTLAPEPAVLFMDEPLSNLDAKLRLEMRSELQRLHIDTGSTFIYVTHDQMEAMTLATKICLIDNGVLQQYDAPLDVYNKPNNLFVADFVGNPAINFMEAKGHQAPDGTVELEVFAGTRLAFTPRTPLDLPDWFARADARTRRKRRQSRPNRAKRAMWRRETRTPPSAATSPRSTRRRISGTRPSSPTRTSCWVSGPSSCPSRNTARWRPRSTAPCPPVWRPPSSCVLGSICSPASSSAACSIRSARRCGWTLRGIIWYYLAVRTAESSPRGPSPSGPPGERGRGRAPAFFYLLEPRSCYGQAHRQRY